MPLEIIRNDITKLKIDAIVNAANSQLEKGGGVCGAIFDAAGDFELQKECRKIGYCGVGKAVITSGYNLPAKHIIHTVGPIWQGGNRDEEKLLSSCYKNSLELAEKNNIESIAFPLISSGIYGFPKDKAFHIAVTEISKFLIDHEMLVYLVVFDKTAIKISEKLFKNIKKYIDDNYVDEKASVYNIRKIESFDRVQQFQGAYNAAIESLGNEADESLEIENLVFGLEETFSEKLLKLIDEKELSDVHVYKKANIDRKLFSKIKSNKDYNAKKTTILAFAIALELDIKETLDLLEKGGYTLSHSSRFDLIVEYFIKHRNYNVFEINEALFSMGEKMLGV